MNIFRKLQNVVIAIVLFGLMVFGQVGSVVLAQSEPPNASAYQINVVSPYYAYQNLTTAQGNEVTAHMINGPSEPLPEFEAQRQASLTTAQPEGTLANFPSYDWVFGCSAVSSAMIAAWYDRGGFPNLYAGPTNSGVMPLSDTSWPTWSDGYKTYPNNPLIASHLGVDGRTIKGSIDDYWVKENSSTADPFITGGWAQHTWGNAMGDYMKTSQSSYGNVDGATIFFNWTNLADKLTCDEMVSNDISHLDGTYGRKLFYEARGYSVGDCYNQKTDNNSGGFTLANFKSEIDSGNPVLLNLAGHSIVGYGYSGSTIYIRDTWDSNPNNVYTMNWGGSYDGMALKSVSVVKLVSPVMTTKHYLPFITQAAVNPIQNPGFEQGKTYWTESSSFGYDLIMLAASTPVSAHGGTWLAWLGGMYDETSVLSQTITVSASDPYLHFWRYTASEDSCGHDYFYVSVNGTNVYTSTLCISNNTNGWVETVVSLASFVGSNKTLEFRVVTNGSLNSNLFLDDVSLASTALMSALPPVPAELYPGSALMGK